MNAIHWLYVLAAMVGIFLAVLLARVLYRAWVRAEIEAMGEEDRQMVATGAAGDELFNQLSPAAEIAQLKDAVRYFFKLIDDKSLVWTSKPAREAAAKQLGEIAKLVWDEGGL